MLAVRIQVIDGARTFTLQDSQPCRLLPSAVALSLQMRSRLTAEVFARPLRHLEFRFSSGANDGRETVVPRAWRFAEEEGKRARERLVLAAIRYANLITLCVDCHGQGHGINR